MKVLQTHKQELLTLVKYASSAALTEYSRCCRSDPTQIIQKSAKELVTEVDLKLENILFEGIRKIVNLEVFSEETEYEKFQDCPGPKAIFDPLDGTHNFIYGLPMWGFSITFFSNGNTPSESIISLPLENKILFIGEILEYFHQDELIPIYPTSNLSLEKTLVFYDNQMHKIENEIFLKNFSLVAQHAFTTRISGSSCWDIFNIATGKAGARIFGNVELYDLAPAITLSNHFSFSLEPLNNEKSFVFSKSQALTNQLIKLLC